MGKLYEGSLVGKGLKFGIVVSRFNEFITNKLLSGAQDALKRHDVAEEDVDIAWVPGAFEIPVVARKMALSSDLPWSSRTRRDTALRICGFGSIQGCCKDRTGDWSAGYLRCCYCRYSGTGYRACRNQSGESRFRCCCRRY